MTGPDRGARGLIKAGVMGWPVDHSRSPSLHGFWLKTYGIDGTYDRLPVRPEGLAAALRSLAEQGYAGFNLTVPHKEAAMMIVDELSPEARRIGAVNTIFVTPEGRLKATNTDAYGFITNLKISAPRFKPKLGPAIVLGAGGAARAICVALEDAGVPEICIINRTKERAELLARDLGISAVVAPWTDRALRLKDAGLLVNTTSLGMKGQAPLEIDLHHLPPEATVTDIVYAPLETPLLAAARVRGNPVVDGLGMLLYQAQPGFEGWFGKRPEVTPALRDHVLAAG
ncbi:MAG: shikimate dehydrogenase [Rhodospirillaceae bacterium]|nr:shikimate dehydrogenase [Rhodospirillaceae bacterium]